MKLIDTNILIYSEQEEHHRLKELLKSRQAIVSEVTRLETLGYMEITEKEEKYFKAIFQVIPVVGVTKPVIDRAIVLRKEKKMKLADCLIASTALIYNAVLVTRNTKDFEHIDELTIEILLKNEPEREGKE